MTKRHFLAALLIGALVGIVPYAAYGQAYSSNLIRIIVSSAPGGTTDQASRLLAQKLQATFGQPVVVENKTGASGYLATEYVAHQRADGYTLITVASSHSTNNALNPKYTVHPIKDFVPISLLTSISSSQYRPTRRRTAAMATLLQATKRLIR